MPDTFACADCGRAFTISESVRVKYPNWTPKQCMDCRGPRNGARNGARNGTRNGGSGPARPGRNRPSAPHSADGRGPQTGIFTDGSCQGNPGPGGWGVVVVRDGEVLAERHGFDPSTTNNRMELTAIIEGLLLAEDNEPISLYTDSNLAVNTLTKWAAGWEKAGWKRREGPVKNLDLVQRAYQLSKERPHVRIEWVPGHSGYTWNERADELSTEHLRSGSA